MTDARGNTPDQPAFYDLNHDTWVMVGRGGKNEYIYQKIADNSMMPICKSTPMDCGAPDWKTFRERETGQRWAEIAKGYEGMMKA